MSEAKFYLIAAGLHALLPLGALIAPSPVFSDYSAPIQVDVEVEVEPTRPPTVLPAAVSQRTDTPRNEEALPTRVEQPRSVAATNANIEPGPTPSVAPTGGPVEPGPAVLPGPNPSSTGEYSGPPPVVQTGPGTGLGGLGIGGPAWAVPGVVPDMGGPPPAPTAAPKSTVDPKIATKVLFDAMKEKDKSLGIDLPAAGTVASSVRSAVQATDTPPESRATFEVKLSPTGQVLSVRVTSSSGGSTDVWARAAKQVQAALSGRALGMTSTYAKGAVVYVNVQSVLTLPDGTKSAITQKGAGATFDLANIGAHMQRSVRSSFSVVAVK
ncbi:MAG: hypothetical protein IPK82_00395 [Polyangiaceae bacterium]|nr:hypothetical protein [Polyangiaceae bacterium]